MSTKDNLTWQDTSQEGFKEVTLHGDWDLMDKRVKTLTAAALSIRITDPEGYLALLGIGTQIADQIYFD